MKLRSTLATAAAVAAAAAGGGAIASAASSTTPAATATTPTTTTTTTQPYGVPGAGGSGTARPPGSCSGMPAHGMAGHENAEKAVTGDAATKAQAAAVKAVGSGTAGAVTTDYSGNGYEVTVTKSDSTKVEVRLDSSFNAMPGPGAMRGGPMPAPGTGASAPSSSAATG